MKEQTEPFSPTCYEVLMEDGEPERADRALFEIWKLLWGPYGQWVEMGSRDSLCTYVFIANTPFVAILQVCLELIEI